MEDRRILKCARKSRDSVFVFRNYVDFIYYWFLLFFYRDGGFVVHLSSLPHGPHGFHGPFGPVGHLGPWGPFGPLAPVHIMVLVSITYSVTNEKPPHERGTMLSMLALARPAPMLWGCGWEMCIWWIRTCWVWGLCNNCNSWEVWLQVCNKLQLETSVWTLSTEPATREMMGRWSESFMGSTQTVWRQLLEYKIVSSYMQQIGT